MSLSNLDSRDKSIIRQVAFKAAIDVIVARGIKEGIEAPELVRQSKWLTDEFEKVIIG